MLRSRQPLQRPRRRIWVTSRRSRWPAAALGSIPKEQRSAAGKPVNEARSKVNAALDARHRGTARRTRRSGAGCGVRRRHFAECPSPGRCVTDHGDRRAGGGRVHRHGLGRSPVSEVETEHHNFDAPSTSRPTIRRVRCRTPSYIAPRVRGLVLRTHTSPTCRCARYPRAADLCGLPGHLPKLMNPRRHPHPRCLIREGLAIDKG